MYACHNVNRFCKGAATWPAGITDTARLRGRKHLCKLFRQDKFDDLCALDA